MLFTAGRTGGKNTLSRNISALESLARLRENSKLLKLGISDSHLGISDVYIRIGNQIVEIETKAGTEFFTNVAGSSSNFAKQSYNSLKNVASTGNYKVFLRKDILETLDVTKAKDKVIEAWSKFENGAILTDPKIRSQFTAFARKKLNNPNILNFSRSQLEAFLKTNDDWFVTIFKDNF